MTVDLEAISRRTNIDLPQLRTALPLIEQGYAPPFLARYRRDELGGLSEHVLWSLYRAVREDAWIRNRRDDLLQRLEQLPHPDAALARAIKSASSKRVIDRLSRRVRSEGSESGSAAKRVAARILCPEKGDPADLPSIANLVGHGDQVSSLEPSLDAALASRLAGHPQMQATAVRWLINNAKIKIVAVKDTHTEPAPEPKGTKPHSEATDVENLEGPSAPKSAIAGELSNDGPSDSSANIAEQTGESLSHSDASDLVIHQDSEETDSDAHQESQSTWPTPEELALSSMAEVNPDVELGQTHDGTAIGEPASLTETTNCDASVSQLGSTDSSDSASQAGSTASTVAALKPKENKKGKPKPQAKAPKELKPIKKISPRQRRRRWLVGVLQPLAGKTILAQKLTAFQTLMLGRGLRSGIVQCQFVYDTEKLVDQLQRTASGLNEAYADRLAGIVRDNEAMIRESSEGAWWDELLESAATRLVGVAADHLESQINRDGVEAKVVLSIDAMGPRTAAAAIVAADGRLLHTEDVACQLSAALRSSAVTRIGELIHRFGVDLIVISNGPVRRACLVILHELVDQSAPSVVRWTIAERSGADVYAGSELGNREMRSTPRRFRAAAWLAFSVLRPSQAVTKVDPMRLRLGSFQRELSDDALWPALRDVMTSGVSRGGVDVNSAPVDWLSQLPGLNREVATAIDRRRREALFNNRAEVTALDQWADAKDSRQGIPFLRVFGSSEHLDGTLIHPDDYALAKKLATALKLELPPATPPGYQLPKFDQVAPSSSDIANGTHSSVEEVTSGEDDEHFAAEIQPVSDEPIEEVSVPEDALASPVGDADNLQSEQPDGDNSSAATSEAGDADAATAGVTPVGDTAPPVEVLAPFRQATPDPALVNKCIKEWQIGARRVRQLVDALCNPFGEEDAKGTGAAHAVMTRVPKLADLKIGDQVIGVVVGVTEFGAFVEMSPECSGLIHVSRVADRFVEDLHEAVQVGDVVTAWVTAIDAKRRRVGLSAVSPERELELDRQRNERRDEMGSRGGHDGNRGARGDHRSGRGEQRGGAPRTAGRDDRGRSDNRTIPAAGVGQDAASSTAPQARTNQRQEGGQRPDNRGPASRGAGQGDSRGAGPRGGGRGDARGGNQRGGQRGGRRDRDEGPTSYSTPRVPRSDVPANPITDAMAKGDEPLRSFGDLMQFFKKAQPEPTIKPTAIDPEKAEPKSISASLEAALPSAPASESTVKENQSATVVDGASPES